MVDFKILIQGLNLRPEKGYFGYSSVVLIKDGQENILFDTGGYGVRGLLIDALKKINITKVFVSHLHFDHAANLDLFKNIPIYIHQKELDFLKKNPVKNPSIYLPVKYILPELNIIPFKKEIAITANVSAIPTPGHTDGHSSLTFLKDTQKVVILGDAIKSHREFFSRAKEAVYDQSAYKKTKKFLKNSFDVFVPGHDRTFKKNQLEKQDLPIKLTYF